VSVNVCLLVSATARMLLCSAALLADERLRALGGLLGCYGNVEMLGNSWT